MCGGCVCCPVPWRRQWQATPVLLPGKSHGRRSLVGCSPWGRYKSGTTKRLYFHFSLACIGEGNGNPLQCSCLENPRERGAWWAAVSGVAQNRTRLKWLSSSSSSISGPFIHCLPRGDNPKCLQASLDIPCGQGGLSPGGSHGCRHPTLCPLRASPQRELEWMGGEEIRTRWTQGHHSHSWEPKLVTSLVANPGHVLKSPGELYQIPTLSTQPYDPEWAGLRTWPRHQYFLLLKFLGWQAWSQGRGPQVESTVSPTARQAQSYTAVLASHSSAPRVCPLHWTPQKGGKTTYTPSSSPTPGHFPTLTPYKKPARSFLAEQAKETVTCFHPLLQLAQRPSEALPEFLVWPLVNFY